MSKPIVDLRRSRKSGESILEFVSNGNDATKRSKGRFVVNKGRVSPQDYQRILEEYKNGGPCPHLYQPALIDAAKDAKAVIAATGRSDERPEGWDENELGKWNPGDVLGDPRLHHNRDLRKRIPSANIVDLDDLGTFVLGIWNVNPQVAGSYAAIVEAVKRALFPELDIVRNLVGQFNDAAYIDETEDGGFLVWNPYQTLTWGHLVLDGTRLSHDEIATLVAECEKHSLHVPDNVTFEPLDEPITRRIPLSQVCDLVRELQGEDYKADKETLTNVGTLCRFHPRRLNCFGLRNVQAGIPLFKAWDGTSVDDMYECICMSIGARLPVEASENKWAAKARLTPPAPPKVPKKRGRKPKTAVAPPVEDTSLTAADIAAE